MEVIRYTASSVLYLKTCYWWATATATRATSSCVPVQLMVAVHFNLELQATSIRYVHS